MTETSPTQPQAEPKISTSLALPAPNESTMESPEGQSQEGMSAEQKKTLFVIALIFIVGIIAIVAGVIFLLQPTTDTPRIRDVFIIVMAIQSLFMGLALIILMIQMARLINLLNNEVRPILDSINETISHLRGTTTFLSDNLTEPVIKLNEYLAGLSQFFYALGLLRKPARNKSNPTSNTPKGV